MARFRLMRHRAGACPLLRLCAFDGVLLLLSVQRCDALDAGYTRAKVFSAAGGALGVRVSAEAMEIEP